MNLTRLTALEARRLLINKEVSPIEMVNAAFERISETDQELNAIPTLCIDNPEDQKRFDEGKLRMEHRLKERKK